MGISLKLGATMSCWSVVELLLAFEITFVYQVWPVIVCLSLGWYYWWWWVVLVGLVFESKSRPNLDFGWAVQFPFQTVAREEKVPHKGFCPELHLTRTLTAHKK